MIDRNFFIQGKEFISAKDASRVVKYNPAYIAQLCREGKITAKLLDKMWFVAKEELTSYKAEADKRAKERGMNLQKPAPPVQQEIRTAEKTESKPDWDELILPKAPPPVKEKIILPDLSVVAEAEEKTESKTDKLLKIEKIEKKTEEVAVKKPEPEINPKILTPSPYISKLPDIIRTLEWTGKIASAALALAIAFVVYSYSGHISDLGLSRTISGTIDSIDGRIISAEKFLAEVFSPGEERQQENLAAVSFGNFSDTVYKFVAKSFSGAGKFFSSIYNFGRGGEELATEDFQNLAQAFIPPENPTDQPEEEIPSDIPEAITAKTPAVAIESSGGTTVIEKITERSTASAGISLAILNDRLSQTENALKSEIYRLTSQSGSGASANFIALAPINKIDNLRGVTVSNATISNSSFAGSISGTTGSFDTFSASTASFTSDATFDTNTLFVDSANNRVGIGTTSPQYSLDVDGTLRATSIVTGGQTIGGNFSVTGTFDVAGDSTLGTTTMTNLSVTNTSTSTFAGGLTIAGAGFVYQQATGRVGIGTTSPAGVLDISTNSNNLTISTESDGVSSVFLQTQYRSSVFGTQFAGVHARGTKTAPQALLSGDRLMELQAGGHDGTNTVFQAAVISMRAEEDWSTSGRGTNIQFQTTANQGLSSTERMRLTAGGNLGIASTSPWGLLSVNPNGISGPAFVIGSSTATNFIVTNGGNVGIGTTTPESKLHIAGSGNPAISIQGTDAGGVAWLLTSRGDTGQFRITESGVGTYFAIDKTTGNVGIGTTTPLDTLHVTSAVSTAYRGNLLLSDSTAIAAGVGGQINFGGKFTGSTYTEWAGIQGAKFNSTDGNPHGELRLRTRNDDGLVTRATIDRDGNVGIGTTSPQAAEWNASSKLLHIGQATTNGGTLKLESSNATGVVAVGNDQMQIGTISNDPVRFYTNLVQVMTILGGGSVGIGTTTPVSLLQVAGTAAPKITISDTDAGTNFKHWFIESNGGNFTIGTTSDALVTNSPRALTIGTNSSVTVGGDISITKETPRIFFNAAGQGQSTKTYQIQPDLVDFGDFGIRSTTDSVNIWRYTPANTTHNFIGNVAVSSLTSAGTRCVQADSSGFLSVTGGACGVAGAAAGTWATTTSQVAGQLTNYPLNSTDIVVIGATGTTTAEYWFDPNLGRAYLSGNVGIGTTNPSVKLTVQNDSASGRNDILALQNSTAKTWSGAGGTADSLMLKSRFTGDSFDTQVASINWGLVSSYTTSGTRLGLDLINSSGNYGNVMTLTGAGNVGIGTTTPGYNLTITSSSPGNGILIDGTGTNAPVLRFSNSSTIGPEFGMALSPGHFTASSSVNDLVIDTNLSSNILFATNGLERVRITSTGLVGIGTTSPQTTLHISSSATGAGFMQLGNAGGSNQYQYINFGGNTAGQDAWQIGRADQSGTSATAGGFYIYDIKSSATRLTIASTTGNVGIGTTSPWGQLSVANTSANPSFVVADETSPDTTPFIIDTNGNVGIGTINPKVFNGITFSAGKALHLADTGGTAGIFFEGLNRASMWFRTINGNPDNRVLQMRFDNAVDGTGTNPHFEIGLWNDAESVYTTRFTIRGGTGNVGIGATTPTYKLEVSGLGRFTELVDAPNFVATSTTATSTFAGGITGPNNFVVQSTSGNVGIGTTTPDTKLAVSGTHVSGRGLVWVTGTDHSYMMMNAPASGEAAISFKNNYGAGWHIYRPGNSTDLRFFDEINVLDRVTLTTSGNVGIGTTTPTEKLSIAGTDTGLEVTGSARARIDLFPTAGGSSYRGWQIETPAENGNVPGGYLGIIENGVGTRFTIASSTGNVGIGTTTPNVPLTIKSDSSDFALRISQQNAPQFSYAFKVDSLVNGVLSLQSNSDGVLTTGFTQDRNGSIGIGTTSPANKLEIYGGNLRIDKNTADSIPAISIKNDARDWEIATRGDLSDKFVIRDQTAGGDRLTIDSSGNVGIGTTTPTTKFSVGGVAGDTTGHGYFTGGLGVGTLSTTAGEIKFGTAAEGQLTYDGTNAYLTALKSGGSLIFRTNGGTEAVRITNGGNVGVGTTSPFIRASATGMAVSGTGDTGIKVASTNTGGNAFFIARPGTTGGDAYFTGNPDGGTRNMYVTNQVAGNLYLGTGSISSTHLTVDSSGKVGVGTFSETAKMSISKGTAPTTLGATDNYLNIGNGDNGVNTYRNIGFGYTNNARTYMPAFIGYQEMDNSGFTLGDLIFGTRASVSDVTPVERLRITSAGNVGIGTTSPGVFSGIVGQLTIVGNGQRVDVRIVGKSGSNDAGMLDFYAGSSGGTRIGYLSFGLSIDAASLGDSIWHQSLTGQTMYVQNVSNGVSLAQGGTSWGAVSDERLKTDIQELSSTSGLAALSQLIPVTYDWKDVNSSVSGKQLGFTAQNVQEVFPGLVYVTGTTTISLPDGSMEMVPNTLNLNYTGLIPPMVKAIQELDAKIDAIASSTASSTLASISSESIVSIVLDALDSLGVEISQGIVKLIDLTVEALTIGSSTKPAGITMYDEDTKTPYCVKIKGGIVVTTSGQCIAVVSDPNVYLSPGAINDSIASTTPTNMGTTTPVGDTATTTTATIGAETTTPADASVATTTTDSSAPDETTTSPAEEPTPIPTEPAPDNMATTTDPVSAP